MAVDYRKQYTPQQLAPFWPSEVIRMIVAALLTLSVITVLAVLPVILDDAGLGRWIEESEPANPRATPAHIRPEWYFLPAYQYLKLAPREFLGVSGKTIGVLSQGVFVLAVVLLPFWARRWSHRPPSVLYHSLVTLVIGVCVALMLWAVWPPPAPLCIMLSSVVVLFCVLLANERRRIRRVLREHRKPSRWYRSRLS
jgi:quinol-cytochrome oxidoreductase complex cytochrome b subunit